jgi:hypothetical protein
MKGERKGIERGKKKGKRIHGNWEEGEEVSTLY